MAQKRNIILCGTESFSRGELDNVALENGAIVLCHDIYETTADAAVSAIPELVQQGYQLVTVSELLSFHKDGATPGTVYSHLAPENIDVSKGQ